MLSVDNKCHHRCDSGVGVNNMIVVATYMAGGASTSYGSTTIPQGPHSKANCLPTITNQDELALSMGSSSSSRRSSDPLSSEPGTPTHPPTFQNLHHFQVDCLLVNSTKFKRLQHCVCYMSVLMLNLTHLCVMLWYWQYAIIESLSHVCQDLSTLQSPFCVHILSTLCPHCSHLSVIITSFATPSHPEQSPQRTLLSDPWR